MRLTHHHKSSRSFIILVIIVLTTVFSALVLTRIQKLYRLETSLNIAETQAPAQLSNTETNEIPKITEWEVYQDSEFPLSIDIPKGWSITPNNQYQIDRHLELKMPNNRTVIRIFISKTGYVDVDGLDGEIEITSTGDNVINYDGIIYATRVGDYYYTYDATGEPLAKEILAEIVDKATYEIQKND